MLDLDPSLSTRARLHHRLLLPWLLAIAACQGKDGLLSEFTSDSTSGSGTSTSTGASTGPTTGTTGDLTSSGSDGATAATTATDAGTTMAGDPTSSGGETTSGDSSTADPETSGSGSTGEGFCQTSLDCGEGLQCVQDCTDDCDQSMFPNPCCSRLCWDFEPRACEVIGGLCQSTCGPGRYPAANADVWTCFAPTACCLPEVDGCADHLGQSTCESEVGCKWVFADCDVENCNYPDKGTCQPA